MSLERNEGHGPPTARVDRGPSLKHGPPWKVSQGAATTDGRPAPATVGVSQGSSTADGPPVVDNNQRSTTPRTPEADRRTRVDRPPNTRVSPSTDGAHRCHGTGTAPPRPATHTTEPVPASRWDSPRTTATPTPTATQGGPRRGQRTRVLSLPGVPHAQVLVHAAHTRKPGAISTAGAGATATWSRRSRSQVRT